MAGVGDYTHFQSLYSSKNANAEVAAGGTGTISAKSTSHQLWIQKVTISIKTHANAKNITLADTNSSAVTLGVLTDKTAAAGVPDVVVFDFGPEGFPCTVGKDFTLVSDSSGPAFTYHVEAYEKLGASISYLAGSSKQ